MPTPSTQELTTIAESPIVPKLSPFSFLLPTFWCSLMQGIIRELLASSVSCNMLHFGAVNGIGFVIGRSWVQLPLSAPTSLTTQWLAERRQKHALRGRECHASALRVRPCHSLGGLSGTGRCQQVRIELTNEKGIELSNRVGVRHVRRRAHVS